MLSITNIFVSILISVILTLALMPATRLTRFHNRYRFGSVKKDGQTESQLKYLSGVSFAPIVLVSIGVTVLFTMRVHGWRTGEPLFDQLVKLMALVSGMLLLFVVGLKDDLHGIRPFGRFMALFFAASLISASGTWINDFYGLFGLHIVPFWVGMPFTTLLVMYLTATINMTDGIDGLASGYCSVSLFIVLLFSILTHSNVAVLIASAGLGVMLTFFVIRITRKTQPDSFMGSSGSLPMGFLVCFVILHLYKMKEWHGAPDGVALAAFCTMLLPTGDMLRVVRSRLLDGRSVFEPDKNMLFHKLLRTGLRPLASLCVLGGITLFFTCVNGFLLNHQANITVLFVADVAIFVLAQLIVNYIISRNSRLRDSRLWEKTYGPENWDEEETETDKKQNLQEAARNILLDEETPRLRLIERTPEMNEIPFIPDGMNVVERNAKRLVDFAISGMCLIVFSPLFLLSYIVIKMDDGGPAIYKQQRIGRFGRPFYIYKFRSMRMDAEKAGPQLSHTGGDNDSRLTKAGLFLRAHHLDELPQLWNVFCGEMAFIGYRPERQYFIKQIAEHDPRYYMLYQIRPGVTSYATLYNGYTDTMEKMLKRLELDLYYLKHRSWWFDMKILFLTFMHIVGGKKF